MIQNIKKICLFGIYAGIGVTLLAQVLIYSRFFYPFISTRVFIFRAAVEIMLFLYLALNFVSDEYRPRFSALTALIAAYIAVSALSSLLGPDPSGSFWGDIERGEGIIMWLHLLAYFVILAAVLRTRSAWNALLDSSLVMALFMSAIGVGQALRLGFTLSPSGTRVDASMGNPAFFATYLLFHIAFAFYLMGVRRFLIARIYYGASVGLFVWLIVATQTRGAVIALAIYAVAAAVFYALSSRGQARAKKWSAAAVLAVLVLAAGVYFLRDTPLVQSVPGLRRVANVSLESRTVRTRLVTWQAAWKGFLEKPFLGWGQDSFTVVFNKYFPPYIYAAEGSQVWFDRAHSVVFDRAATGGIVGLVLFLSVIFYPLYHFLRRHLGNPETRRAAVIFSAFLAAYLFQDLFIFESVAVYIVLFLLLSFFSSEFLPQLRWRLPWLTGRRARLAALIVCAAAFGPALWYAVIHPARVNMQAAAAGKSDPVKEDFFQIIDRHRKYLDGAWTYGMPEYRLQFIDFVGLQLAPAGAIYPEVQPILSYTDGQVDKLLAERPYDAKSWLVAARHYNYTHAALDGQREARLRKAIEFAEGAIRLSPTRPPALQEAGYSHLYMYRAARDAKDEALVAESLALAEEYFQRTIDLNPTVYASYSNLIMLYLNSRQTEKITPVIAAMEEASVNFRLPERLRDLLNLSKSNGNYFWAAYFARELSLLEPDNPDAYGDWALAEAYQGNRAKAIEIANVIRKFGPEYEGQANDFINRVNSGYFEEQAKKANPQ